MNMLKEKFAGVIIVVFAALLLVSTGCGKDPCESAQCGYGQCKEIDGEAVCDCDSGYERDADGNCNTPWYEKFIGSYTCTEIRIRDGVDTNSSVIYPVEVTYGGSSRRLVFSGLGGLNDFCDEGTLAIQVRLDSTSEFTFVAPQSYCSGDPDLTGTSIEGAGKLEDGEIRIEYKYAFDAASNNHQYVCEAVLRK